MGGATYRRIGDMLGCSTERARQMVFGHKRALEAGAIDAVSWLGIREKVHQQASEEAQLRWERHVARRNAHAARRNGNSGWSYNSERRS
jgi:hypothetical protein